MAELTTVPAADVFEFGGVQYPITLEMGGKIIELNKLLLAARGITEEKQVNDAVAAMLKAQFSTVNNTIEKALGEKIPAFNEALRSHPQYQQFAAQLKQGLDRYTARFGSAVELVNVESDKLTTEFTPAKFAEKVGAVVGHVGEWTAEKVARDEEGKITDVIELTFSMPQEIKVARDSQAVLIKELGKGQLMMTDGQMGFVMGAGGLELTLRGAKAASAKKEASEGAIVRIAHKFVVIGSGGAGNESDFKNSKEAAEWLTREEAGISAEGKQDIRDNIAKGYGGEIYKARFQKKYGYTVYNVAEDGTRTLFES